MSQGQEPARGHWSNHLWHRDLEFLQNMLSFTPHNASPNHSRPNSNSYLSLLKPWKWLSWLSSPYRPNLSKSTLSNVSLNVSRIHSGLRPEYLPVSWRSSPRRPSLSLPTYPNPNLPHLKSIPDPEVFLSSAHTSTRPRPFLSSPRRSLPERYNQHHQHSSQPAPSRYAETHRHSLPAYVKEAHPVQPPGTPPSTPNT